MNVQHYKNIILPLLSESFDEREAASLFKYVLEDYFNKRFFDIKDISLTDDELEELNFIYEKTANHYPVQYIFNKAHFYGLEFYVDEHVLIPRMETEELVNLVLSENEDESENAGAHSMRPNNESKISVLDIGTGSGCIPIALKKNRPKWKIAGLDISEEALKIARRNAEKNGVEVDFIQSDILDQKFKIQNSKFNIIISNPPYIPKNEQDRMSSSTIQYEPHLALFVENENPLIFFDKIADFALVHLVEKGKLYFELNEHNAHEVKELLLQKGFHHILLKKDISGKNRMLSCVKPNQ